MPDEGEMGERTFYGAGVPFSGTIKIMKQKNGTSRPVLRIGGEEQNEDNGNRLWQMGVPDHMVS